METRRTALITGASGGIGSAVAKSFAASGYLVALNYFNNDESINKLADELASLTRVIVCKCDLTDYAATQKMYKEINDTFGFVDTIINNAGVSLYKLFSDCTKDDYDFIMQTNFKSAFNVSNIFCKDMISNKFGRIINVSSYYGKAGGSMEVLYSASKSAVNGFTKALSRELAPSNITVNAVAPGLIDTKMNSRMTLKDLTAFTDNIPLGRRGSVGEVAELIKFLADEKASYITGQIISIDGGLN